MFKKMITLLKTTFFILLLLPISCKKKENPVSNSEENHGFAVVISKSPLTVRAEPRTSAKALASLKTGSRIQILAKSEKAVTIHYLESPWYEIKSDSITGWVFGGYLLELGSDPNRKVELIAFQNRPLDEYPPFLALMNDQTFMLEINECEGLARMRGKYDKDSNDMIILKPDYPERFFGGPFKFKRISRTSLLFTSNLKVCAPRAGDEFSLVFEHGS